MSEPERRQVQLAIAQLRHAYMQLAAAAIIDQPRLAKGLIGPQIERLERLL